MSSEKFLGFSWAFLGLSLVHFLKNFSLQTELEMKDRFPFAQLAARALIKHLIRCFPLLISFKNSVTSNIRQLRHISAQGRIHIVQIIYNQEPLDPFTNQ
jgi:hypothetical protein